MQDRKPLRFEDRWLWHNADHPLVNDGDYPDHLPQEVFEKLTGFIPRENPKTKLMVRAYMTRDEAMAALDRATRFDSERNR